MTEFDDRELVERLGRASGAFPDENAAYATVVRDARRARRRRAVAASTAATAAIVALVFVGVALRGRDGTSRLTTTPSTPSLVGPSTTLAPSTSASTTSSSTTSTSSTTTSTSTTTTAPSTLPPNDPPPTIDTTPVVVDTAPATGAPVRPTTATTTTRKRSTTTAPRPAAPDPAPPPAATPTPTAPAPQITVQTFGGQGGTIDVRSDGTSLTVVGTDPAGPYSAEVVDATGRRIEVRMSSRHHRTTIRVELRSGQMVPTVSESDMGGGMDGGSGREWDPPDSMP